MSYDKLLEIYNCIPEMQCKAGCHDCCGVVPFALAEMDAIGATEQPMEIPCQFLGPDGCTIYDKRPYMCRVFGTADANGLRCPAGCTPQIPLSAQEASDLTARYAEFKQPIDAVDLLQATIAKYYSRGGR